MSAILFYVSGHGFGHAVRASQVIHALAAEFGRRVVVRTASPAWLYPKDERIIIDPADVDAGPAQIDCLTTDIKGTKERFSKRLENLEADSERELEIVRKWRPSVIVSDIAPLGVLTGVKAGLPSVVVANFLWDWILADYATVDSSFADMAHTLTGIYSEATAILRTPLSGGMDGYSNVVDIPLIARRSGKTMSEARARLGLSLDRPVALVSLGGVGLEGFFDSLKSRVSVCDLVTLGDEDSGENGLRCFDRRKTPHEDLMAASDVVIGKMGYGLCSEIIANRKPLLCTPRYDFVEYNALSGETGKYVAVEEIPRGEFFSANLDLRLSNLLKAGHPPASAPINGAQVAARLITGYSCVASYGRE